MLPSFLSWVSPRNEKHLMALCLNNPNEDKKIYEFNKSAVRFLIKELRKSPKLLNELERAVSKKCSDSKCITIPATSERRLLVAHRRCKPQVIYCRLWRWPDLQSQHQIKSKCPSNVEAKGSAVICINPYHYERNIPRPVDPVLVPCSKIPPDLSTSFEDSEPRNERTRSRPANLSFIQHLKPHLYQENQTELDSTHPDMLTADSIHCESGTDYTMVSNSELRTDQITQIYNGTYTQASAQSQINPGSETNRKLNNGHENSSPCTSRSGAQRNRLSSVDVTNQQATIEKPHTNEQAGANETQNILDSLPDVNRFDGSKSDSLDLPEKIFPEIGSLVKDEMMQEQNHTDGHKLINDSTQNPDGIQEPANTGLDEISQCSPQTFPTGVGLDFQSKLEHDKDDGIEPPYQSMATSSLKPHVLSAQPQQQFTLPGSTQHLSAHTSEQMQEEYRQPITTAQQQFYQQQLQPPQYQQSQYQQVAAAPQQQYLQAQANLQSSPYQLQARNPFDRSQGRHFQKQQQSHMSSLQQSQYQNNMSQGDMGSLANIPKPLTPRLEIARPFRFRSRGFAGRVGREQVGVCRDPRYNGYIGDPYPCGSQRMATPIAYPYSVSTQPTVMVVVNPTGGSATSQQVCSSSNSSISTVTAQQTLYAQVPNTEYPTLFSPQQQYSTQDRSMQVTYQTDSTMSGAGQPSGPGYYTTSTMANHDQSVSDDQQMNQTTVIDVQEVPYTDDKYWCSITYHEYDQRIGEKYHSSSNVVSVDGFTQPMCNDRFCIGGISNVNRNQFTEWVRRRIGRGVKLTYVDGNVYVEGISESSIFVSSPLHVVESHKGLPDDLVVKLTSGCSAQVFSTHEFGKLLHDAVAEGFEAVYKLANRCVIRVSFVKGWGKNYKRQSIYNTPCWVEVQLNGPLQWIDKVLRQMRPPMGCGSTS